MDLTKKDIELAKKYLVLRTAIKGLSRDKEKINEGEFELKSFYAKLIEDALINANDHLRELNRYPIQINITSQPTVYNVKIDNRIGYFEMNIVEITEEISKLFNFRGFLGK